MTRLDTAGVPRLLGRRCGSWEQFQAGQCCDQPTATMGEWLEPRGSELEPGSQVSVSVSCCSVQEGKYYFYVSEDAPFALGDQGSC